MAASELRAQANSAAKPRFSPRSLGVELWLRGMDKLGRSLTAACFLRQTESRCPKKQDRDANTMSDSSGGRT